MMDNLANLLGDVQGFLALVTHSLEEDGMDVSGYELDHICYKVETAERYKYFQGELAHYGDLLTETPVGGRKISTYKLEEPILFAGREIYCVELPFPKADQTVVEGLQHAEFVIDIGFEEFMKMYPQLKFDQTKKSKLINPHIARNYNAFSVKFHHHSLEYVIKHFQ